MSLLTEYAKTFTISGTGAGIVGVQVFPTPARGRIAGVTIRATGGPTLLNFIWLLHTPATSVSASAPADEYVIGEGAALPLVASATNNSGRTRIDCPPSFSQGLGASADVVASGAWTLEITLDIVDLNGTNIPAS